MPAVALAGGKQHSEHDRKGDTNIVMWKLGALSGVIVDEYGEPIVDIEVRAVQRVLVSGARSAADFKQALDAGAHGVLGWTVHGEFEAPAETDPVGAVEKPWVSRAI